jgi:hypothetical protein
VGGAEKGGGVSVASARERGGKGKGEGTEQGRKEGGRRTRGGGRGDWPRRAVSDRSSPSAAVGRPRGA